MDKVKSLDRIRDLSFQMARLAEEMYKSGCTYDDVQQAVEDGAREYRILIGEEEEKTGCKKHPVNYVQHGLP